MFRTICVLLIIATLALANIDVPIRRRRNAAADQVFMKKLALQRQGKFTIQPYGFYSSLPNEPLKNALPEGQAAYYGPITMGSNNQLLNFDFDTGSSNFWVTSIDCSCANGKGFNGSASSTYKPSSTPISISYGSGSVSGHLSVDAVSIAAINVGTVTFGEITSESMSSPLAGPIFGLVGLAFKSISVDEVDPLFDTMYQRGLISNNAFGMYLSTSTTGERQGVLTIGGANPNYYSGSLVYTPIVDSQWYVINTGGFKVGNTVIAGAVGAIVDSGTSCLAGPSTPVSQMMSQINIGSDCSGIDTAPNITVTIAGVAMTMTPYDYTFKVDGQCQVCIQGFNLPSSMPFKWILGDSFMHAYYVEFDKTNKRLGFAPSRP